MADGSRPRAARPTLKTVAREAGVSTTTVSFVLSGRPDAGISEATAQRVHEAVRRLGYYPNSSARAVRTGRTGLVLLSLNMLSDPWSLALADAVNSAAKSAGLTTMILADGDWFSALELQGADVAYIGLGPDRADDERRLATMVERGQKVVVFDELLEPAGFDVIRSKSLPGCRIAVESLIERHTDIACLTSRNNFRETPSRLTVYREVMAEAGLEVREDRIGVYEETQAEAYAVALDLLSASDRPTAIYATTDFAAIAAINAAHRLGIRVPEDVAVIGVGNTPDAGLTEPSLSTVGPIDQFALVADIIVKRALEGPGEVGDGTLHELDWVLIERESTRA
ncbi:LacI family transcriptional regulator [Diaminobutyricibacter tongyongensis]|uniref:LacI family transcriptional regulator n=1 Tax=Leifsonia tongyongensis TaxID=1268043 RepID=A0A6L9XWK9_9MICO|nr:LacI family DNA-binding transcriptional regulator [Diaminobutyricibacter tongyongensis]NEN05408.1 LacI family transcriptional regulator [Diaminobutyricibacter tongyongensis]